MGLDLVEYVLAVEDAFEIAIPDADAARLATPAQLIDYLCRRLGETADGPPLLQTAFYRVRVVLAEEVGVPRSRIRPGTVRAELTVRPEPEVWDVVARRVGVEPGILTQAPLAQLCDRLRGAAPPSVGQVALDRRS